MNKNTFMYPVRMTAVLAAAALVTSCAKDKFTEANALDLELKRLRTEDSIRVARERQQRIWDNNRLAYNRVLDSLDRINAGGRVFYTVTAVAAGNAAFGTGRVEEMEGVQGATVSIAQYGNIVTQTTPASGMATVELRSGSASVVVSAPNHTTVNYTVNLTADGDSVTNNRLPLAPGNGHTVHVGNVIPLFPTSGAGTATVRGRAYIETDLTNETAELVTPAVLGAGANLFTANIDINPIFRERYLDIANSVSARTTVRGVGFEGQINRISYENATTNVVVDAQGNYSGVVPATASGLPLQLRYSQIAADRRFWALSFDGQTLGGLDALNRRLGQVITRRFIYGPFPSGNDDPVFGAGPLPADFGNNASISFNTELAPAQVTAALTSTGKLLTETIGNVKYFVLNPDGNTPADRILPPTDIYRRGLYLADVTVETDPSVTPATILPPEVTFSAAPAGGTTATGIVELGPELASNEDPITGTTSIPANSGRKFRRLAGIRVTNEGSGYTSAPTITFTRRDGTAGTLANAGKAFVTGKGTLQAPTSQIAQIQVIDGGFGFLPLAAGNSSASRQGGLQGSTNDGSTFGGPVHYGSSLATINASSPTKWTGMTPRLPNGPFGTAGTAPTLAEADAVFHYNAIGTIDRIELTNPIGAGITQTMIDNFNSIGLLEYGDNIIFPSDDGTLDGGNTECLFVRDGGFGLSTNSDHVVFNFRGVAGRQFGNDLGNPSNTPTSIGNFLAVGLTGFAQPGSTIPYVFLPNIAVVTPPGDVTPPGLSLAVGTVLNGGNEGKVISISLNPGSTTTTSYNYNPGLLPSTMGIPGMKMRITPVTTNSLRIRLFPSGSGIDNYVIDQPSQQEGRFIEELISDFAVHPTPPSTTGNPLNGKEGDTYIVEFDPPKDPLGTPAKGRPVFNNNRQLIGIDIINPGAGYSSSSPPNFRVIPNPKEGDTSPIAYVDDDAKVSAHLEPAQLVFTIQNGGRYAACPDVFLSGGGVTLAQQPQNAPGISSIFYVSVLPSGFPTIDNGDFELKFDATTGAIKSIKYTGALTDSLPPYTSDPTVTISPARQNDALNRAWASVPQSLPLTGTVGTRLLTRSISTNAAGAITGIELTDRPVTITRPTFPYDSPTPIRFWEVASTTYANLPATPGDDWLHFANQQYIIPPAVNIASSTGTGAQAVALLENNILADAGKLRGISVTAGGTGYRVTAPAIPRNGNILSTYNQVPVGTSVGFFRNFGITAPGDGASGSALTNFDAFSGVTYIRDVHYGTGRYFGTGQ